MKLSTQFPDMTTREGRKQAREEDFQYIPDDRYKPVVSHAVLAVATLLLIPVILLLIGLIVRYGVQIDGVEVW